MKNALYALIGAALVFSSCTKNDVQTSSSLHSGLIKTLTDTFPDVSSGQFNREIWLFIYDEQNRVANFTDSTYRNSYLLGNTRYNFTYPGSGNYPTGYSWVYTDYYGAKLTESHFVAYDDKGNMLLDSLIVNGTNSVATGNKYFTYADNLIVRLTGFYQEDTKEFFSMGLDSVRLVNDNVVSVSSYINVGLSGGPALQLSKIQKTSFSAVVSPYYQSPAGIIYLIRGGFPSKNCPLTDDYYYNNSDTVNSANRYSTDVDLNGILQRLTDISTGDRISITYY